MTNSQRLATVRACLLATLASEAADAGDSAETEITIQRESILIRNEFYCGRRFYSAHHHAVWFIEEDELKVFRSSGELVCTLSHDQIDETAADAIEPDVIPLRRPIERNEDSDGETRRAA